MTEKLIPVGHWIQIELPGQGTFIGYTYLDAQAGFSAQGGMVEAGKLKNQVGTIIRLQAPNISWQAVTEEQISQFGLPAKPDWVEEFYGPQPPAGMLWGWWRDHPQLNGRFHPQYADDLQVLVHDGGPRLSPHPAEQIWVRVIGGEGDVFTGQLLNQPHKLQSVRAGSQIQFIAPHEYKYLLMVTSKYLEERPFWTIHPCQKCGLSELFDAPSDLIRVVFPDLPEGSTLQTFTSFCGVCRGVQIVERKQHE